jgi:hypothetical protein
LQQISIMKIYVCVCVLGGASVQDKRALADRSNVGYLRENDTWSHKVCEAGFITSIHWILELEKITRPG